MSNANLDSKRWIIAIAGTCLQICLGTAYAWSFFQKPRNTAFGRSQSMTAWAFYTFWFGAGILAFGFLVTLLGSNKPYEKK